MTNALTVDVCHTGQYLPHVVFYLRNRNGLSLLFCFLYHFLQVLRAIFEYYVLNAFSVVSLTIVNV